MTWLNLVRVWKIDKNNTIFGRRLWIWYWFSIGLCPVILFNYMRIISQSGSFFNGFLIFFASLESHPLEPWDLGFDVKLVVVCGFWFWAYQRKSPFGNTSPIIWILLCLALSLLIQSVWSSPIKTYTYIENHLLMLRRIRVWHRVFEVKIIETWQSFLPTVEDFRYFVHKVTNHLFWEGFLVNRAHKFIYFRLFSDNQKNHI